MASSAPADHLHLGALQVVGVRFALQLRSCEGLVWRRRRDERVTTIAAITRAPHWPPPGECSTTSPLMRCNATQRRSPAGNPFRGGPLTVLLRASVSPALGRQVRRRHESEPQCRFRPSLGWPDSQTDEDCLSPPSPPPSPPPPATSGSWRDESSRAPHATGCLRWRRLPHTDDSMMLRKEM